MTISLDDGMTAAERAYFESGGQDIGGVLAEAGRGQTAGSEPDGLPELSEAERHYFSSHGD